jgi:hypothetical protein
MQPSTWTFLAYCASALAVPSSVTANKRADIASLAARAQSSSTPPPASEVQIKAASASGTGCPDNTVSVSLSTDLSAVTLGFDQFDTYIGPGVSASQSDKSCVVLLSLHYPSGYTFAVAEATYHGYAQLDSGVRGSITSVYKFEDSSFSPLTGTVGGSGAQAASSSTSVTIGSSSGRARSRTPSRPETAARATTSGVVYTETDTIPANQVVNAPCGKTIYLLVNTTVLLTSSNPKASGELTDDDATIGFTQGVHFGWKKCGSSTS